MRVGTMVQKEDLEGWHLDKLKLQANFFEIRKIIRTKIKNQNKIYEDGIKGGNNE